MKSKRGVTLVELIVVISITAILAGVSIRGFSGIQSWRAAAAAKRFHADCLHARNLAILSSRRTAIVIVDAGGMVYQLRQETAPTDGALITTPLTQPLTGQDWQVALGGLASGLTLQANDGPPDGVIGFNADGLPIDTNGALWNADVNLLLSSGVTIEIERYTGIAELIWP